MTFEEAAGRIGGQVVVDYHGESRPGLVEAVDEARRLVKVAFGDPVEWGWYQPRYLTAATSIGAVRRCAMPDCPAWFDAFAAMDGYFDTTGWRRWSSLNLRLCPDHSWLWTSDDGEDAPHRPHEGSPHRPCLSLVGGTCWVECACGWRLDTSPYTAGESGDRYAGHLAEVVPGGTLSVPVPAEPAPEGSQCAPQAPRATEVP